MCYQILLVAIPWARKVEEICFVIANQQSVHLHKSTVVERLCLDCPRCCSPWFFSLLRPRYVTISQPVVIYAQRHSVKSFSCKAYHICSLQRNQCSTM